MTDERLQEIKERYEAATKGPWFYRESAHGGCGVNRDEKRVYAVEICGDGRHADCSLWTPESTKPRWSSRVIAVIQDWCKWTDHPANRDFIVNSRQDIPDLIAEVERLRAENAKLMVRSRTRSGHE